MRLRSRPLSTRPLSRALALVALLAAALTAVISTACASQQAHAQRTGSGSVAHQTCVAGTNRQTLTGFQSLVGFPVRCADVFDDSAPTWATWDTPWFTYNRIAEDNWTSYATAPANQLTITLTMIPDAVKNQNWLAQGAAGNYTSYAKILARNLIRDHMANVQIRLGTEANGNWEKDSIGDTPAQWHEWVEFWRKTVKAMRSVKGAHFTFNWCINNGYRNIPFADYYPGNDVVNSIGVDVYDTAPANTANRFGYELNEPGGLAAISAFAKAHHKPLTIPEWGLLPKSEKGDGDDPAFVTGLGTFVAQNVTSESYFYSGGSMSALRSAPRSLAAYRKLFNPRTGSAAQSH